MVFLFVLKELHNISKLYGDGEEHLSAAFRELPLAVNYLIDRSLLFKESFEIIAHVKAQVLAQWHFIAVQRRGSSELWCITGVAPENSLFEECLEDHGRYFPNFLASVVKSSLLP